MKKILKRETIVLFVWPIIMWITIIFFTYDENLAIAKYFLTHPLFIFLFFLLNLFGCGIFHEEAVKTSLEEELRETDKKPDKNNENYIKIK